MIITDRFVFVHMHQTGGQTLHDVIGRCISECRIVGHHYPRSKIPGESAALPAVRKSALGHKQPFSHILAQRLLAGVKQSLRNNFSEVPG